MNFWLVLMKWNCDICKFSFYIYVALPSFTFSLPSAFLATVVIPVNTQQIKLLDHLRDFQFEGGYLVNLDIVNIAMQNVVFKGTFIHRVRLINACLVNVEFSYDSSTVIPIMFDIVDSMLTNVSFRNVTIVRSKVYNSYLYNVTFEDTTILMQPSTK